MEKSTGKWGSGTENEKAFDCSPVDILAKK
jgi:hypothetical protein